MTLECVRVAQNRGSSEYTSSRWCSTNSKKVLVWGEVMALL